MLILHCHVSQRFAQELQYCNIKIRDGLGFAVSSSPVVPQLDPDNLLIARLLPRATVAAGPRPLGHLHLQTLRVEGGRARVAAQQLASCVCSALWEISVQRKE